MRRTTLFLVAVASLVVAFSAPPASATPPTDVEIVATAFWEGPSAGFSEFSLTGVEGCEGGTTADLLFLGNGRPGVVLNFHVVKLFTCTDGSTFTLLIRAQTRDLITDEGTWTVLSGTGRYEELHGTGNLLGIYLDESGEPVTVPGTDAGITDTYTGSMHID
jgi:hypothetical protein